MTTLFDPSHNSVLLEFGLKNLLSDGTQKHSLRNGTGKSSQFPLVDLFEDKECFRLAVDLPGVAKEDVEVLYQNGSLLIQGQRQRLWAELEQEPVQSETPHGSFCRRIMLPKSADGEKIEAELRDGVLRVTVSKKAEAQPKKIAVQ